MAGDYRSQKGSVVAEAQLNPLASGSYTVDRRFAFNVTFCKALSDKNFLGQSPNSQALGSSCSQGSDFKNNVVRMLTGEGMHPTGATGPSDTDVPAPTPNQSPPFAGQKLNDKGRCRKDSTWLRP